MQKLMNISFPLADNYADPLLLMPVLLHLIKIERQFLFQKKYNFTLPEVILWSVVISIITEYFFPKWNTKFAGDIIDVLLYFAGALLYFFTDRSKMNKQLENKK